MAETGPNSQGTPPEGRAPATDIEDARLVRLLRGCAAGNAEDLEGLYRAAAPRLLGQLVMMLGDRAAAEDALQEIFIKVWDRAGQYEPTRGRPMTWLLSVTRNHAIDQLRSRRKTQSLDDLDIPLVAESPEWSALESGATAGLLARCMQQLSREQQRCLQLAYVGGLSQEQIAATLDSPLGSVKSWVRRALLALRECMGG